MMLSTSKKFTKKLFFIGLILAIVPYIIISFYNIPSPVDDFNNAVDVKQNGTLGFIETFYKNWTGRYTLLFILAYLNPLNTTNWLFWVKVWPVLYVLGLSASIYYFITAFLKEEKRDKIILIWLGLVALLLYGLPTIGELFYWFTGAATYTTGGVFFFLLLGSLKRFTDSTGAINKLLFGALSSMCIVCLVGTNESSLMAALFFLFVLVTWAFWFKYTHRWAFLIFFLVMLAACYISITAPGNMHRSNMVNNNVNVFNVPKLIKAMVHSLFFTVTHIAGWMNNLCLILASVFFIPVGQRLLQNNCCIRKALHIHPLIAIVGSIIFMAVQAFPSYLAMSDVVDRVWSLIYISFIFSWVINLLVLINYCGSLFEKINVKSYLSLPLIILFLVLLLSNGNTNNAYIDLISKARSFQAQWQKRYQLMENGKGQELVFPPIFEDDYQYPKTLYTKDISIDNSDYKNQSMSRFFNVTSVKLKK